MASPQLPIKLAVVLLLIAHIHGAKFEPRPSGQCSHWIYVYDLPPEFNIKLPGYFMADSALAFPDGIPVRGDQLPQGLYSQVWLGRGGGWRLGVSWNLV